MAIGGASCRPAGTPGTAVLLLLAVAAATALLVELKTRAHGSVRDHQWCLQGSSPANGSGSGSGSEPSISSGSAPSSRLLALARCTDFACLRAAHGLPAPPGSFAFPHFFILGFPKCATTSLAAWLGSHPQAVAPVPKETQFFTKFGNCSHPDAAVRWGCAPAAMEHYIVGGLQRDAVVAAGLGRAAFDASTAYSWGEFTDPASLATGIRRELPWLRLVLSMREPISHQISRVVHHAEVLSLGQEAPTWFAESPEDDCLRRWSKGNASMYECLLPWVTDTTQSDYATALAAWLTTWPREQLHVIQFENLTAPATRGAVLADLQRWLGMDSSLSPPELPLENSRKANSEGWPMQREEYLDLVSKAQELSNRLTALLEGQGFMPAQQWMAAWEAAWQRNLGTCNADGKCLIKVT